MDKIRRSARRTGVRQHDPCRPQITMVGAGVNALGLTATGLPHLI
jgi:hypothetical protein